MRHVRNALLGVASVLVALSASTANALDTREVVVEKNEGIVVVPRHLGQVLATPNRTFSVVPSEVPAHWTVHGRYERLGTFRDSSAHLRDPRNLFYQTTYFDFNMDQPIGADVVGKRLSHQMGPLSDDGIHYVVVGHADEVGTASYNMALSIRRAKAVVDLLVAEGHRRELFQVIGRGKSDPISFRDQHLNRRVEVIVRGSEQAQKAFKDMRNKVGGLTCRGCLEPNAQKPTAAAPNNAALGSPVRDGENRQPMTPTSTPNVAAERDSSATVKALEKMRVDGGQIAAGAPADKGFRADQNPPGAQTPSTADAFAQILNPAPIPIPATTPIGAQ
jgi:OOP family OmpA-OmpF porin